MSPVAATNTTPALSTECPECAASVTLTRRPLTGEVVRCTDCRAELEVVSLSPLRVELAPEVREDWGE